MHLDEALHESQPETRARETVAPYLPELLEDHFMIPLIDPDTAVDDRDLDRVAPER